MLATFLAALLSCGGAAPRASSSATAAPHDSTHRIEVRFTVFEEPEENGKPRTRVVLSIARHPEATTEQIPLGTFDGACTATEPADDLGAELQLHCWWAGAGDDLMVFRVGERVVVRQSEIGEMEGPTPLRDVAGFGTPAGVEVRFLEVAAP